MKEHPILFSTPMVQAILAGRKNMTRRVVKSVDPKSELLYADQEYDWKFGIGFTFLEPDELLKPYEQRMVKCILPGYGQPGDLLWVRETMILNKNSQTYWPVADGYVKTSDYEKVVPSIHVPKSASRIWLRIINIRVERLTNITEEDAKKEGVLLHENGNRYFNYTPRYEEITQFVYDCWNAKSSFKTLWNSINKFPYDYRENPWVWVVEFEILSTTGKPEKL